jgi:hypothetical protein
MTIGLGQMSVGIPQTQGFYDRYVLRDWNLSELKRYLITPQKGRNVVAVSMGWADRSGGVRLEIPDYPAIEATPFDIDPYSHFIGTITRPFNVLPSQPQPLLVDNVESRHTLDLLVWYCLPPCDFPKRGPAFLSEEVLAGAVSSRLFVRGRKRVTFTLHNLAPAAAANNAEVIVGWFTTGGSTLGQERPIYSVPLAPNESAFYELDASNELVTAGALVDPTSVAPTQVLYVRVRNTDLTESISCVIEARDY